MTRLYACELEDHPSPGCCFFFLPPFFPAGGLYANWPHRVSGDGTIGRALDLFPCGQAPKLEVTVVASLAAVYPVEHSHHESVDEGGGIGQGIGSIACKGFKSMERCILVSLCPPHSNFKNISGFGA